VGRKGWKLQKISLNFLTVFENLNFKKFLEKFSKKYHKNFVVKNLKIKL
jgi:hypothetical protein